MKHLMFGHLTLEVILTKIQVHQQNVLQNIFITKMIDK